MSERHVTCFCESCVNESLHVKKLQSQVNIIDELNVHLKRECGRVREESEAIREALTSLVEKLKEVHNDPRYRGVWACANIHLGAYYGMTYGDELHKAEEALAKVREAK